MKCSMRLLVFFLVCVTCTPNGVRTVYDDDADNMDWLPTKDVKHHFSAFTGQTQQDWITWKGADQDVDNEHYSEFAWSGSGKNKKNNRMGVSETLDEVTLSLSNPLCRYYTESTSSATPGIIGSAVIIPHEDGSLRAFHRFTCRLIWVLDIGQSYFNATEKGTKISHTTPVFAFGGNSMVVATTHPAHILHIDVADGKLIGKIQADDHPFSAIYDNGQIYNDIYFVGIDGDEEGMRDSGRCCLFSGSVVAIDLISSKILWKTPTIHPELISYTRFSGAPVHGSSPPVWEDKRIIYFTTGDNYEAPEGYATCLSLSSIVTCREDFILPLIESDSEDADQKWNLPTTILGFDIETGHLKVRRSFASHDSWVDVCNFDPDHCYGGPSDHNGFNMAPTIGTWCHLLTNDDEPVRGSGEWTYNGLQHINKDDDDMVVGREIIDGDTVVKVCFKALYVGQKNGVLRALRASTLETIWAVQASPPGPLGGISKGLALNDDYIYMSHANSDDELFSEDEQFTCGAWEARKQSDGSRLWLVPNPACDSGAPGQSASAKAFAPPIIFNNLVLVASPDSILDGGDALPDQGSTGWVYLINSENGEILESYDTGSSLEASFAMNKDCVYIPQGITGDSRFSIGNYVYVWCNRDVIPHKYKYE